MFVYFLSSVTVDCSILYYTNNRSHCLEVLSDQLWSTSFVRFFLSVLTFSEYIRSRSRCFYSFSTADTLPEISSAFAENPCSFLVSSLEVPNLGVFVCNAYLL